jgi:hypothetical protein
MEFIDKMVISFEVRLIQFKETKGQSISKDIWRMGGLQQLIDWQRTQTNKKWP